ncbi:hypothetical protein IW261DRAFT_1592521 [Armillaria novae-zelandiae]|uniref:F-box domain-containing protein n=1 Tax=Armillaria novae-zelandiae TaxID=153914 RepID=A0AA39UJE9_9AGAR|nr:hypothetical protein IW261DRAFT_1592521 [Armillaria novae-zelandiae]
MHGPDMGNTLNTAEKPLIEDDGNIRGPSRNENTARYEGILGDRQSQGSFEIPPSRRSPAHLWDNQMGGEDRAAARLRRSMCSLGLGLRARLASRLKFKSKSENSMESTARLYPKVRRALYREGLMEMAQRISTRSVITTTVRRALHQEMCFVMTQQHSSPTMLNLVEKYKEPISNSMSARAPALYALRIVRINIRDEHNASEKQFFIGPWPTFVEAIFLLPALETLELEASRSAEQTAVETRNLRLLLDANRDTLETLELPAELANGLFDAMFTSLRELSLFEYGPIHHTWARALPPQSNLRKLHIEIVSSSSPSPSPVASHLTCSQLYKMRSLTLSNLHPDDPLFSMLPSNLEYLSLVPYPEPFMWRMLPESKIPVNIIPCSAITTILTSSTLGNLVNLDLSYQWESDQAEVSLLALVPRTSPYLESLELNRYGSKGSPFDVVSPLETSLRNLKYLSHLRLNLEKKEGDRYDLCEAMLQEDRVAARKEAVEQLAQSIPSL